MYPNVRGEMRSKKITLEKIAEVWGVTVPTVSLKLKGKYPISLNEAVILKRLLKTDLPLEELFREEAS